MVYLRPTVLNLARAFSKTDRFYCLEAIKTIDVIINNTPLSAYYMLYEYEWGVFDNKIVQQL